MQQPYPLRTTPTGTTITCRQIITNRSKSKGGTCANCYCPVLNEENTIANVVRFCLSHPLVSEVIVVDDKSEDKTPQIAAAAGARVITSQVRGKGISMKDGIDAASHEIVIFLDGDIDPYPEETISRLAEPLVMDEVDFVKGSFARNAGRVTELVAKPLLKIFYPGPLPFCTATQWHDRR